MVDDRNICFKHYETVKWQYLEGKNQFSKKLIEVDHKAICHDLCDFDSFLLRLILIFCHYIVKLKVEDLPLAVAGQHFCRISKPLTRYSFQECTHAVPYTFNRSMQGLKDMVGH